MNAKDFTSNTEVQRIITELESSIKNRIYSDVIDDEGNQYVDLVQEGGGVLLLYMVDNH